MNDTTIVKDDPAVAAVRRPPQSIAAEQAIIGGLLIDNSALDSIDEILETDDFIRQDHRTLFEIIYSMITKGIPADALTVAEEARRLGKSEETGGTPYLVSISNNVPSAANIRRYAEIVHDKSVLRQLISVSEHAINSALVNEGRETDEIIDEAERNILAINEKYMSRKQGWKGMPELMRIMAEEMVELAQSGTHDVTGVKTGFENLDNVLSGMQRGDLIILAGRPSMGKTSLALNIAEYVSVIGELPTAVFSMEMSAEQLARRLVSSAGNIDAQRLRKGMLTDEEWMSFSKAVHKLEKKPLFIDDTPGLRITELASRARRLVSRGGPLGLIVVDYIQLMQGRAGADNRTTELSEISRGLKCLAKELNCPIIVLSQLNRSLESRTDKRPIMSDLRESGAIEQDADVIIFIYRDEVYNKDSQDKGMAEIIVRKQRNGPIGTLRMVFRGANTRFLPWAGDVGYWQGSE